MTPNREFTGVAPCCARFRSLLAALLILCGVAGATSAVASEPAADAAPRGSLIIVGGGDTPASVQERFVALAGGPGQARIAVFPMASTRFDEEAVEVVVDFNTLGADAYVVDFSRSEAQAETMARYLEGFTGFWFLGGNQTRLAATLLGTRALATIERLYRDGAVIGGTSAGAAVMTAAMLTGKRRLSTKGAETDAPKIARGTFEVAKGFGFLPGAIVDQHFLQRDRYNRLLSAVLEQPHLIGVGIDEETAVLVRPDGRWEVLGDSYVKIIDARRARVSEGDGVLVGAAGIRMHLLPEGGIFDPKSGRAVLPGG